MSIHMQTQADLSPQTLEKKIKICASLQHELQTRTFLSFETPGAFQKNVGVDKSIHKIHTFNILVYRGVW